MKRSRILLYTMAFVAIGMSSCDKWTEAEPSFKEEFGKSKAYYEDLRNWKAAKKGKRISFGWFGGWSGEGASLQSSLIGIPDSMDMVSIWGDWKNLTPAKIKDLKFVQEEKGTKVLSSLFAKNVGDGFTPEGVTVKDYWGWDPNETALNEEPSENQKLAIQKYARAIVDLTLNNGYDGVDIDHEPNFGGEGNLASSYPRLRVFFDEMSKYVGPSSGTDKILCVDGEPQSIPKEIGKHFNYFIVQAYDATSYTNLNNRLSATIRNHAGGLTAQEVAEKYIVTENFEKADYFTYGGAVFRQEDGTITRSLAGMAKWQPLINGVRYEKAGVGAYHFEYEYQVPNQNGFYPFMRNAIRIMNSTIEVK